MIPVQEIIDVIKAHIDGDIPIIPVHSEWCAVYCGDVPFRFGDYVIEFYNDCNELDYVETATAPDGRTAKYNDWEHDPLETMYFTTDYPYLERLETLLQNARLPAAEGDAEA